MECSSHEVSSGLMAFAYEWAAPTLHPKPFTWTTMVVNESKGSESMSFVASSWANANRFRASHLWRVLRNSIIYKRKTTKFTGLNVITMTKWKNYSTNWMGCFPRTFNGNKFVGTYGVFCMILFYLVVAPVTLRPFRKVSTFLECYKRKCFYHGYLGGSWEY